MAFLSTLTGSFVALVLLNDTAAAIAKEEAARLEACVEKVETDPENAYEDGLAWLSEGHRPGARYCTALALIELGHLADAAARLEALANAPDGGTLDDRKVYLSQAGNAWLGAGLPKAALTTLENAVKLSPNDAGLRIDRARALILLERWYEAEADLDASIAMDPGIFDAYYLRAEARFAQKSYQSALDDVQQARAIDPENIDILVLRGKIRDEQSRAG